MKAPHAKILIVDLSSGAICREELDPKAYRLFPGGRALAAYLLLKGQPAHTDALAAENQLVLAAGLLTGAPFSTATRFTAAARSPLTGGYGESEAGGFWGPELKLAGWDAIVVRGRAATPVYLAIRDEQVEIRPADHLWSEEPYDVQAAIRAELGDRLLRVLQIGPGGEKLVRYAGLTNELRHYNGRNGMGAVMGSKHLRAVAVRGSGKYLASASDPEFLSDLGRRLARGVREHPQSWDLQVKGTPGLTGGLNAAGILPTRNFWGGAFEGTDRINWEAYESELLTARRSCYACAIRCKREVAVHDRYEVSDAYGGPEYETVAGFGSNCGVDDLQAIAKANELCGRFVIDSISTAGTIAFAMECFEHGLIGLRDTDGLDLRFGNAEAMLACVEKIGRREGIGDLLAEGSRLAAKEIGDEAPMFAMHVKGQELPMHDPRGKVAVGLGFAVSETGADHLTAVHDPLLARAESVTFQGARALGITEPMPVHELSERKARAYAITENWSSFERAVGLCYFGPAPRSYIQVDDVVGAVQAASGWDVDKEELLRIGERATNLARAFSIREGFGRPDDTLPERLFGPLHGGAQSGRAMPRDDFERTLTQLYLLKGWDPVSAAPTRVALERLELGWVADLLEAGAAIR